MGVPWGIKGARIRQRTSPNSSHYSHHLYCFPRFLSSNYTLPLCTLLSTLLLSLRTRTTVTFQCRSGRCTLLYSTLSHTLANVEDRSMYRSPATSLQRRARGRKRPSPIAAAPAITAKTMGNAPGDVEGMFTFAQSSTFLINICAGTHKHVEALRASIMKWTSHFEYIWRSSRWLVACFTRRCQG